MSTSRPPARVSAALVTPTLTRVVLGTTVCLQCQAYVREEFTHLTFQWLHNGTVLQTLTESTQEDCWSRKMTAREIWGSALHFSASSWNSAGNYTCQATLNWVNSSLTPSSSKQSTSFVEVVSDNACFYDICNEVSSKNLFQYGHEAGDLVYNDRRYHCVEIPLSTPQYNYTAYFFDDLPSSTLSLSSRGSLFYYRDGCQENPTPQKQLQAPGSSTGWWFGGKPVPAVLSPLWDGGLEMEAEPPTFPDTGIYYRLETNDSLLERVSVLVRNGTILLGESASNFQAEWLLIITYNQVRSRDLRISDEWRLRSNTYQMVLAGGNMSTYVILLYPRDQMQWWEGDSLAGFNAGILNYSYTMGPAKDCESFEAFLEDNAYSCSDLGSNTGVRGLWILGSMLGQSCPSPIIGLSDNVEIVGPQKGTYAYRTDVVYCCKPGYQLFRLGAATVTKPATGTTLSWCQENGTWSNPPPNCTDVDECITNTHSCRQNFVCINTVGSYRCQCPAGYEVTGSRCQEITCGYPRVSAGSFPVLPFNQTVNSIVTYACNSSGDKLILLSTRRCLNNGRWSEPVPQCTVLSSQPAKSLDLFVIGPLSGSIVFVFIVFFGLFVMRRRKTEVQRQATFAKRKNFMKMLQSSSAHNFHFGIDCWHIPENSLRFGDVVGAGHFSDVSLATLRPNKEVRKVLQERGELTKAARDGHGLMAAVKLPKVGQASNQRKRETLQEAELLLQARSCSYVVCLYGLCSINGFPCIVMEFMPNGNLQTYLRASRVTLDNGGKVSVSSKIALRTLVGFGQQVALGMAELTKLKLVHRDLAARNILVEQDGVTVKISDFGLARDVYEKGIYEQTNSEELASKWQAIEVLETGVHTIESDVWSFGMLLWETMSLGSVPFPGVSDLRLYQLLQSGSRPGLPPKCPLKVYRAMVRCWARSPTERPSFETIAQDLKTITDDLQTEGPIPRYTHSPFMKLRRSCTEHCVRSSSKIAELPVIFANQLLSLSGTQTQYSLEGVPTNADRLQFSCQWSAPTSVACSSNAMSMRLHAKETQSASSDNSQVCSGNHCADNSTQGYDQLQERNDTAAGESIYLDLLPEKTDYDLGTLASTEM